MLLLVSPAKTLDYESPIPKLPSAGPTAPALLAESALLAKDLKKLSAADLSKLMDISDKLGQLNHERFQEWSTSPKASAVRPAIYAFNGDVYEGLDAQSLSAAQMEWANRHLIILSGLYGFLRPLDSLQPYRLEMGTSFANSRGKDLYAFWGTRVTEHINAALQGLRQGGESPVVVNLASEEYFKVVKPALLESPVVSPVFQDGKNGQFKVVSFYAKRARGLMARYVIQNQIKHPDGLLKFDSEGYRFDPVASKPMQPVFRRSI